MPPEWTVLLNPAAGRGSSREDWGELSRLLSREEFSFQQCVPESPPHCVEVLQDFLARGFSKFILVGGDGLLHQAVNAVFTQKIVAPEKVVLAVIPAGTGNDWARTFGIPADHDAAVGLIRQGKLLKHDIGRVFYHVGGEQRASYFVNICGLGFDAAVNRKVAAQRETDHLGAMKYRFHIFTTLVEYAATRMTLVIDGTETRHEVFSLALGNGQYNGGGMKQLPFAVPDDGLFDITVIRKVSRLKVLRSLGKLYDGSFVNLPEVVTYRGKDIQVSSEPNCFLEADGELLGESPFRFEIIPQALSFVVP